MGPVAVAEEPLGSRARCRRDGFELAALDWTGLYNGAAAREKQSWVRSGPRQRIKIKFDEPKFPIYVFGRLEDLDHHLAFLDGAFFLV